MNDKIQNYKSFIGLYSHEEFMFFTLRECPKEKEIGVGENSQGSAMLVCLR
jgi:hypothetical protein